MRRSLTRDEQQEEHDEAEDETFPRVESEKSLSSQGERQFLIRYQDGALSTHKATTRRFTSQIDGKEVQRTDEEAAAVRDSIQRWIERYPEDSEHVKRLRAERQQRLAIWVRCVKCGKNRKMPPGVSQANIKVRVWHCSLNGDPAHNTCEVSEEEEDTQECKHERHEEWHPDVPREQPLSRFYGRLKVCILCHKKRSYLKGSRRRVDVPSSSSNLIVKGKRTRKKHVKQGFCSFEAIDEILEESPSRTRRTRTPKLERAPEEEEEKHEKEEPEAEEEEEEKEEAVAKKRHEHRRKRKGSKRGSKKHKKKHKKKRKAADDTSSPPTAAPRIAMLLSALEDELSGEM